MACKDMSEYTCSLSKESLEYAKLKLREDPVTRMLEVKAFRERLLQYGHGLRPNTDTRFLLRFLRARKFDQEQAFDMILKYYRMKKQDARMYTGLKPLNVLHVYPTSVAFPLPFRDRLGRQVYITYSGRVDSTRYSMEDLLKAEFLNISKMIQDEETQVRGVTSILDCQGFTMAHMKDYALDFNYGKKFTYIWQEAFPVRLKLLLLVNEPSFMDLVLTVFTPLMKNKVLKRMHRIGTNWRKLHEFIDPVHLPREYGGTRPEPFTDKDWIQTMLTCNEEMEEESKYGFVDYTMGRDVRKQQDAINTMAGTFRKLNVD
ncbi:hypothetical protein C0Q70_07859 [Pomacea canaliculata]|uniref:CRAL-TRIO domain-containing protein n=1 Tax=Pomacea canaliculata TaxID=400727 RepID=A0A2T7PG77_POMCA|nr:clavesin-2-like [Pomacea canaliculata]PVD32425.1 hypothetical protein C0Q70_07859 [Pomacea canaliculata]